MVRYKYNITFSLGVCGKVSTQYILPHTPRLQVILYTYMYMHMYIRICIIYVYYVYTYMYNICILCIYIVSFPCNVCTHTKFAD